jgi:hypothetical protein
MASTLKCADGCIGPFHMPGCPNMLLTGLGADGSGGAMVTPEEKSDHQLMIDVLVRCAGKDHQDANIERDMGDNVTILFGMLMLWLAENPALAETFRVWMLKAAVQKGGWKAAMAYLPFGDLVQQDMLEGLADGVKHGSNAERMRREGGLDAQA